MRHKIVAVQIFTVKSIRFFEFDDTRFSTCLTIVFLTWSLNSYSQYIVAMQINWVDFLVPQDPKDMIGLKRFFLMQNSSAVKIDR